MKKGKRSIVLVSILAVGICSLISAGLLFLLRFGPFRETAANLPSIAIPVRRAPATPAWGLTPLIVVRTSTPTFTPMPRLTATPTLPPTSTPASRTTVPSGTPMPRLTATPTLPPTSTPASRPSVPSGPVINPDNAGQLVEITRWAEDWLVTHVIFSPDGRLLASGAQPKNTGGCRIRLWRVPDGKLLATLKEDTKKCATVRAMAFSQDGEILAVGGSNVLWLIRISDGAVLRTIEFTLPQMPGMLTAMAFSPDLKMVAVGWRTGEVRLHRISDGSIVRTMAGPPEMVSALAFSPDGSLLASASFNNTIQLWRVSDGKLLHTLPGHEGYIFALAFSPDGSLLASGSYDKTVKLWRVTDGSLLRTLKGHTGALESGLGFSPDGSLLASGSGADDYTLRLWRVSDGALLCTLKFTDLRFGELIGSVSFSPDGRLLATGDWGGTIRLFGVGGGAAQLPAPGPATPAPAPSTPSPAEPSKPLPACPNPHARITYPYMDEWITGIVPFKGSADIPNFQYYKFEYRPYGEKEWRFLVRFDRPVTKGTLMEWHTYTVPPGRYEVRLTVVDISGNYPEPCIVRVRIYR